MDPIIAEGIASLGVSLATLSAKGTASAVAAKVKALKTEKNTDAIRAAYDELINELLEERANAIMIAQGYKAELDRVQISDEDIASLDATIGRVLDLIAPNPRDEDAPDSAEAKARRDNLQQFRQLVSADTLRTMQLLGFNYKAAIGEPLTNLCAQKIASLGKPQGDVAGRRDGKRKSR